LAFLPGFAKNFQSGHPMSPSIQKWHFTFTAETEKKTP